MNLLADTLPVWVPLLILALAGCAWIGWNVWIGLSGVAKYYNKEIVREENRA